MRSMLAVTINSGFCLFTFILFAGAPEIGIKLRWQISADTERLSWSVGANPKICFDFAAFAFLRML